jgi:glutamine synthetase
VAKLCLRNKFSKQAYFHLPTSIFTQSITGDWMDDTLLNQIEPDMVLRPDYSTASAAPWTGDVTLQIIHDVYDQNNVLYPVAPRNVLKRVIALYQDLGLQADCCTGNGIFSGRTKHRPEPAD